MRLVINGSHLENTSAPQIRPCQHREIAFKRQGDGTAHAGICRRQYSGRSRYSHIAARVVIGCRGGRRGAVFGIGPRRAAGLAFPRSANTQNARAQSAQGNEGDPSAPYIASLSTRQRIIRPRWRSPQIGDFRFFVQADSDQRPAEDRSAFFRRCQHYRRKSQ